LTFTAKDYIIGLVNNNIPLDDDLMEYICPTNRKRISQWLKRLEGVRSVDHGLCAQLRRAYNSDPKSIRKHKHFKVASVQGVKSSLTGKILEKIIKTIFENCHAVSSIANLRSSTAEIDVLLKLGVVASTIPIFRDAGSHILGEAKCYVSGFKQEWVNELSGLMGQHSCSHSLLFVGSPSKIMKIDHRHGLQLHATNGKCIVPIGLKQLKDVANGDNFLKVLGNQYVDVKIGAVHLAI
jgi:hypothetical protein